MVKPGKLLDVIDVILTPLAGIISPQARKTIYATLPVVIAILSALAGSGIFSGQAAIIIGAAYSVLSGLLAAANTPWSAK